ncbi:MAG TPA: nucleoside transporter C-terminal domain-containing protein [Terriglobia bacterium]|nr:nucleoside transporter C-terminal domain-containing protein [Terriglobia bacterium]
MERLSGLFGFFLLLGIAFALSTDRKSIRWKTVVWGITLQLICALVVLKGEWLARAFDWFPLALNHFFLLLALQLVLLRLLSKRLASVNSALPGRLLTIVAIQFFVGLLKFNLVARFFVFMREVVNSLIDYSSVGATFVFGPLGSDKGEKSLGLIIAFQVLPTIIFVASIFAILYYVGLMQVVVKRVSRVMSRFMGSSGAESVSVAASIFMGQTEAPLTIRPFLAEMTRSELMTVMTAGMAHVSGGIMAAYVLVAHVDVVHLLTAVVMTAPGAIMVSKIMVPETGMPKTSGDVDIVVPRTDVNLVDAAARGASEGMHLAFNVAAMLIAFMSLVALVNGILGILYRGVNSLALPESFAFLVSYFPENLQQILGVVFRPIAWAMGVSWKDSFLVGNLLGTRLVLNELVSFAQLGPIGTSLDQRSFIITTFALCGFANFGSIAIQVGGIGALAPSRRHDLAALGIRAMIAGTIANFLSATIAGMIL